MTPPRTAIHPESYYNGEKTYRIAFEAAFADPLAAEVGIELIGLYYMGLDEDIPIPNNITMYSTSGAVITSIIPTFEYRGIFGTDNDNVENVRISGIHFKNIVGEGVAALNFNLAGVHSVNNLIVENCEAEGCSLIRLNGGGRNILVRNNYIHSPVKRETKTDYSRAVQISRNSTSAVHDGVSIEGNVITGNWTHGIEIMGDPVSPISTRAQDPTLPKNARNITVAGNRVVAESRLYSFGGIFLSGVEDAVVAHNHVENYGDVGIDFEVSRNCIAIGNTLKNNNKNMALFGNSRSIMFTRNSSYISVNDEALLHFYNTLSIDAEVDTRNTDIVLDSNMFCTDPCDYPPGTGRIWPGTAGKVTIARNKFINSFIYAAFFDLVQLSIIDNEFDIDYRERSYGDLPIYVSPLRFKADRQPAWRYDILRNRVTVRNAATRMALTSRLENAPILAHIMDHARADSIMDYYLNISDNEVIDVTGGVLYKINVDDLSVNPATFYGTIAGNRGVDEIRYPGRSVGQRAHVMNISGNTGSDGQPYKITAPNNREIYSWETTVLDSSQQVLTLEVPDGLYVGQTKLIVMQTAGHDANVTILRHATSSPELARFTGAGEMPQMLELLWTGTVWETLRATCSFPA